MANVKLVEIDVDNIHRYSRKLYFWINGFSVYWWLYRNDVDVLEIEKDGEKTELSIYSGYVNNLLIRLNDELFEILKCISKLCYQSQLRWTEKLIKNTSLPEIMKKLEKSMRVSEKRKRIESDFNYFSKMFEKIKTKRWWVEAEYYEKDGKLLIWYVSGRKFYLIENEKLKRITKKNVVTFLKGEKYKAREVDEKDREEFEDLIKEIKDEDLLMLSGKSKLIGKIAFMQKL